MAPRVKKTPPGTVTEAKKVAGVRKAAPSTPRTKTKKETPTPPPPTPPPTPTDVEEIPSPAARVNEESALTTIPEGQENNNDEGTAATPEDPQPFIDILDYAFDKPVDVPGTPYKLIRRTRDQEPWVYIGPSVLLKDHAGSGARELGIFAAREFKLGDPVGMYVGRIVELGAMNTWTALRRASYELCTSKYVVAFMNTLTRQMLYVDGARPPLRDDVHSMVFPRRLYSYPGAHVHMANDAFGFDGVANNCTFGVHGEFTAIVESIPAFDPANPKLESELLVSYGAESYWGQVPCSNFIDQKVISKLYKIPKLVVGRVHPGGIVCFAHDGYDVENLDEYVKSITSIIEDALQKRRKFLITSHPSPGSSAQQAAAVGLITAEDEENHKEDAPEEEIIEMGIDNAAT